MGQTARRAFIATIVAAGVVALALALWRLKLVVELVFLGFTISAAMRPGVDAPSRNRVPRAVGVLIHYVALFALIGLFLWLVVPRAISQVDQAVKNVPSTQAQLGQADR